MGFVWEEIEFHPILNFKNLSKGSPEFVYMFWLFFQLHLRMFPYKCPLSQCFYFASVLIFISKSGEGPLLVGTLPSAQPMVVFLFEPYQTFDLSAKVLTLSVNALDFECQRPGGLSRKVCHGYSKQEVTMRLSIQTNNQLMETLWTKTCNMYVVFDSTVRNLQILPTVQKSSHGR